ncbi:DoxX family protein [Paractinoplanes lichenicola]|uniref:DoxX family protein n=1 Tax=Paractinoplanes lichenicola TaxID=2802976 RepID=A0ABS1VTS7_9ACTN|nr:DoxX family protein [Actinoplanes lichenicola]MBL7257882.1 DoxX family protein [Actinoplanes lichenicola]
MFIAYVVVAVVLALAVAGSATAKFRHDERVTAGLSGVGVPESWFKRLALLNYAGALGLLIGIAWRPLGIAAAAGLTLYFLGALGFHIRAKDAKGMPMPAALFVFSAVALALAIASA